MKEKKLILELTNKLEEAKRNAKLQQIDFKNVDFGKQVFVNHIDEGMINPKYISFNQYQQIVHFYKFLEMNTHLTDLEIKELLNSKFCKFSFLRKLIKTVPNFIQELKQNGPRTVAIEYVSSKLYSKENKQLC